jgi:hypothetical protein
MTAYSFTGPTDLTDEQAAQVAATVRLLPDVTSVYTGGARGVDTVACLAALDAFPNARHHLVVPAAPFNWGELKRVVNDPDRPLLAVIPLIDDRALTDSQAYMERNDFLAEACEVLVAFPETPEELRRSGTWATVRRARIRVTDEDDGEVIAEEYGELEDYPEVAFVRDVLAYAVQALQEEDA